MAALIDFEREYMLFAAKRLQGKAEIKDEELTQLLNDTMKEWLSTKAEYLGNKTPDEYFSRMTTDELVDLMKAYCEKNMNVPEPLYGRISAEKTCVLPLHKLAMDSTAKQSARASALSLLRDMNSEGLFEVCASLLGADAELAEMAADWLKTAGYSTVELLNDRYEKAGSEEKAVMLDILCCYPGVDATADKLIERLYNDVERRSFYANIAGKFGDERLLEPLMRLSQLSDMEYFDYIEIINAIDALGGEAGEIREFYGDPDYEALRIAEETEENNN